ncbi:MAG TPA: anthranilate phosphoribosyltransferase, partial [Thermoanaerobaculia bacterium]|nr:anthranilate phosphoribosyltransferase [Thermoanaerobaculia bacterium]
MIGECIRKLIDRQQLSRGEMQEAFADMMNGEATDGQKSAFLIALKMKGESVEEVTGAALAMRERVQRLETSPERLIDTCGTGGDGRGTFNVSTLCAVVAASAGARVAKHGNRAVSSKCGSADLLKALGVNVDLDPGRAVEGMEELGLVFLFAPNFHPAMKAVAHIRREL